MFSNTIPLAECRRLLDSGKSMNIIDVRTPGEFAKTHVLGARLIPLDELDPAKVAAGRIGADEPLYVICHSGARAGKACERLMGAGVNNVVSIEGGTAAWEQMGLPVERGTSKVISLERQVRLAAGAFVFLGTVLAWTVHRGFLIVPAFIGAGLVFSGISNTCGMALALCKMPWNQANRTATPP